MIEIFSLIVLLILFAAAIAIWVILGMMPGRIAKERNHPQAAAINVCGWMGVITMGLLIPLAYIWAYTNPRWREEMNSKNLTTDEDQSV